MERVCQDLDCYQKSTPAERYLVDGSFFLSLCATCVTKYPEAREADPKAARAKRVAEQVGAKLHTEGPYLVLATGMGPQGLRFGQVHHNEHPSRIGRLYVDALPALLAVR